jgi:chromate transporter
MTDDRPTLLGVFRAFAVIGLTSFGGSLSAWMLREFVQRRKWLTEDEFLNGLAISQALPGVNVTNMSIWIGYRLLGRMGAVAGFVGIIVPPALVIILLGTVIASLGRFPVTHRALAGAGAAAVGLSLAMGLVAARRVRRRAFPLAVLAATFVAIGIMHWPLIDVLIGGAALSVAVEYVMLARA